MYGYIYKTTNLINNKIYIGQHESDSFTNKYFSSGKRIKYALSKYGKENFSVEMLLECYTKEELDKAEIEFISIYESLNPDIGYNIAKGGGGVLLYCVSEETRKKISDFNKGKVRTEEVKNKMSSQRVEGKWYNNGIEQKHILKEEIPYYESIGWKHGMLYKKNPYKNGMPEDIKLKIKSSNTGKNILRIG